VLPIAPVLNLKQALDNPFVEEVGMVSQVPHPRKDDLKLLANPLKFDGERLSQQPCSPLGADQTISQAPGRQAA
jgi:crotonobetainyl-CoA:carnitine CoA-transferase CaiB-like acyl-CoA transferase